MSDDFRNEWWIYCNIVFVNCIFLFVFIYLTNVKKVIAQKSKEKWMFCIRIYFSSIFRMYCVLDFLQNKTGVHICAPPFTAHFHFPFYFYFFIFLCLTKTKNTLSIFYHFFRHLFSHFISDQSWLRKINSEMSDDLKNEWQFYCSIFMPLVFS